MLRKWLNAAGIAVLFTIVALAVSQAGPLEPSAPPGPTMKTLDEIPPAWSLTLAAANRYVSVVSGIGVLDKETGLVWMRGAFPNALVEWSSAADGCLGLFAGNRGGWRLPSAAEIGSLGVNKNLADNAGPEFVFDFSCSDGICLEPGELYWTSTTSGADSTKAYASNLRGAVNPSPKSSSLRTLCVRGGFGTDSGR